MTHVVLSLRSILVWRMLTLTPVVVLVATSSTASIASLIVHSSVTEVTSRGPSHLVVVSSGLLLAIISLVSVIFTAFFHDKTDQLLQTCIILLLSFGSQIDF